MQFTSRSVQLAQVLNESFDVHEAVRLSTAGKGYTPAPHGCPGCSFEVTGKHSAVIELDDAGEIRAIYHEVCR
jgi:hypothetical protein